MATKKTDSQIIIDRLNAIRLKNNLPSLLQDDRLAKTAKFKVNDMLKHKYFDHVNPYGDGLEQVLQRSGYKDYWSAGEILAKDFKNTTDTVNAWMKSPEHKKQILDKDFDKVNCYSDKNNTVCHFSQ